MDVVKLLQDCIKKFNLDVNLLRDYAFAICVADNISGSNKKELDVDRFVEHDSELSWNEVLVSLGITPQNRGCKSLPRVQKLRVISDVLSLSLGGTIEGLILTCETSRKLLKQDRKSVV